MSGVINITGSVLDGEKLESGVTYQGGSMRNCTAHRTSGVTLEGVEIITGETHGVDASDAEKFVARGCTMRSEIEQPKDGTFGLRLRGGGGHSIEDLICTSARFAIGVINVAEAQILRCDLSGLAEDAIRVVSSNDVSIIENEIHDFAAFEPVGGSDLHPDAVQVFTNSPAPIERLTLRDNLVYHGKGTVMSGLFARYYLGKLSPVDCVAEGNIVMVRGGNSIYLAGGWKASRNQALGFVDMDSPAKFTLGDWSGETSDNIAQHWLLLEQKYKEGWKPSGGDSFADAITPEREAEIVDAWRAKFRPAALPEGLTPEVVDWLNQNFVRRG